MKKLIVIKTDFPATHHWPDCDIPEVNFLRHPHRHLFYVVMKFRVDHNDRDIEFIRQKKEIEFFCEREYKDTFIGKMSCEDIAEELMKTFEADFVSVFEDNENGAEIYADNQHN